MVPFVRPWVTNKTVADWPGTVTWKRNSATEVTEQPRHWPNGGGFQTPLGTAKTFQRFLPGKMKFLVYAFPIFSKKCGKTRFVGLFQGLFFAQGGEDPTPSLRGVHTTPPPHSLNTLTTFHILFLRHMLLHAEYVMPSTKLSSENHLAQDPSGYFCGMHICGRSHITIW